MKVNIKHFLMFSIINIMYINFRLETLILSGYFFFLFFQTWKILRLKDGALYLYVRVKEWFFCVVLLHTLEVRQGCLFSHTQ